MNFHLKYFVQYFPFSNSVPAEQLELLPTQIMDNSATSVKSLGIPAAFTGFLEFLLPEILHEI